MKCFYHKSDLDGHCSGAIIKNKYPECEMIGVDYNDKISKFNINNGEKVFVVDFCFEPHEDMITLNNKSELCWVDHHKTSIDWAYENKFLSSCGQSLEVGKAGCELTWKFLNTSQIPYSVELLGRYDVWDHKNPDVLHFQYGMRQEENTLPDSPIWNDLFKTSVIVSKILERGKIILEYEVNQNKKYAKGMFYEAQFEGYRAIVMNKPYSNSKVFDSVYNPDEHDIMILFGVKPDEYKYSLYCSKEDIDVSKIAKKYGGGGHKSAAGFYSNTFVPMEIKKDCKNK